MSAPEKGSADVRSVVRERYGQCAAATNAAASTTAAKVGASCCSSSSGEPAGGSAKAAGAAAASGSSAVFYEPGLVADLPAEVTDLSMGCGDPVTLALLQPGQVVLDLGSGGGIDCFLAARAVGASGRVIGVDMTAEMLDAARANKAKMGVENVEFRLGEIEHLPVADGEVDVIISNCVINLSPDKGQVFREAFRALKPGGRLAISDIVTDGPLPEEILKSLSAWAGCVAGALDMHDYRAGLEAAGFGEVQITAVPPDPEQVQAVLEQAGLGDVLQDGKRKVVVNDGTGFQIIPVEGEAAGEGLHTPAFSARITAVKPR